ncbi:dCTP deaminase domain-containing protein [Psychrobacter sp. 1Y1]|uniref:dCTP deaminase domain-containing protein n=2 Tax=Psychrobacter TaxID=497 RepID=UPI003F46CF8A
MSFLGREDLRRELKTIIPLHNKNNIDSNKYELSLGHSYSASDSKHEVLKAKNGQIIINPGQFCFLETQENIKMPNNLMAFISIKAGIKFKGLVNISGFHVDPHFEGKIVFSVLNAGPSPINLTVGKPLFQIWFAELKSISEGYNGKHQKQSGVTGDLINKHMTGSDNASPAQLQKQINELDKKYDKLLAYAMVVGAILTIFTGLIIKIIPVVSRPSQILCNCHLD